MSDTTVIEERDPRYTIHLPEQGYDYDCSDDAVFHEYKRIDGIVTCTECGDRPYIRDPELHKEQA